MELALRAGAYGPASLEPCTSVHCMVPHTLPMASRTNHTLRGVTKKGGQAGLPGVNKKSTVIRSQDKTPSSSSPPPPLGKGFLPRNKVSRTLGYIKTCPLHFRPVSHHNKMQNKCPVTQQTRVWCPFLGRKPAPKKNEPQSYQNTGSHLTVKERVGGKALKSVISRN